MTSTSEKPTPGTPARAGSGGPLRALAFAAVIVGALGAAILALSVGLDTPSPLLTALFAFWVISPFVPLAFANIVAGQWPKTTRTKLHIVSIVLALGMLAIYLSVASGPPSSVFPFLAVPLFSWVVLAAMAMLAVRAKRKEGG
jgi:peptidoglycan/LPS O-acetylase OafA/YrhL